MNSSDFRRIAREKLSGKWVISASMILCYSIVIGLLFLLKNLAIFSPIIFIIIILFNISLSFGLTQSFLSIFYNEDVQVFDFFKSGSQNFERSIKIGLSILSKLIIPLIIMLVCIFILFVFSSMSILLTIFTIGHSSLDFSVLSPLIYVFILALIPFMTNFYYYRLANIIAIENPNITPKEAVELSKKYMTNNRWKLFVLEFSFIGWAILSVFTLGIGFLWLIPYIKIATVAFSKHVCNNDEVEVQPTNESTEEQ